MASRSGPRAAGTDGSDYSHREKVASHYKLSADLKKSVQKCLIPHILIAIIYVIKQLAVFMGSTYFLKLEYWEQLWLISGLCAFIAFGGLQKNDLKRLMAYVIGNPVFGLIPLLLGTFEVVHQIQKDFKDIKKTPENWRNSPIKLSMIAVCATWQLGGLISSIRLMNAWRSMNKKNK